MSILSLGITKKILLIPFQVGQQGTETNRLLIQLHKPIGFNFGVDLQNLSVHNFELRTALTKALHIQIIPEPTESFQVNSLPTHVKGELVGGPMPGRRLR